MKTGKNVKIKEMNTKNNVKIVHYIDKVGTIVGKRIISCNDTVPIIEFEDCTRIWIFSKELEVISSEKYTEL
ncbi:cytochrome b6-f complex subunit petP (plastid) [Chondrus crispus]|uniref:Cytochrome b6-f complex subunit petP n=1 Tax=Chondrus crispus TaxID=2769 RepID=M5DDH4_CHOCR|nr:cytochrome b6-f complex subunit petP [Chondrus crispus]CCP38144.1 cytochrome b6-f complex subunit petP [Chondrus crispus]|eukprot:YP_007627397.1 cytochrome b6-f complex subunit petP (plastid) [Chondrus crispus]